MLRRLSLLLIATLLLAPWSRHHQGLRSPHPSASMRAVGLVPPSIFTIPSSSRPILINPLSLAGYRLKSENEETDLLVARAPVRHRPPSGGRFAPALVPFAGSDPFRASVRLRC
jgi:hypothetical protein